MHPTPHVALDLLAVIADDRPMRSLLGDLRKGGARIDEITDLAAARDAFFRSGGHHGLLIGPGVAPGVARSIVRSLRTVDPHLFAVSFGPSLQPDGARSRTQRITLHPDSRAGYMALVRWLQGLSPSP